MENQEKSIIKTNIIIDELSKVKLTGVTKVFSAIESNISLILGDTNIIITGKNLHVTKLDLECKILEFEGEINSIKKESSGQNKNFIKRIFK